MEDTKDHANLEPAGAEEHAHKTRPAVGFADLLSDTWELFQNKFWGLFGIGLLFTVIITGAIIITGLSGFGIVALFGALRWPMLNAVITAVVVMVMASLVLWLNTWQLIAFIQHLHSNERKSIKALLESTRSMSRELFPLAIFSFLIILGGLVLFIVPGIILGVLLTFIYLVAVIEHKNPWEAIQTSADLIRKRGWKVFVSLLGLAVFTSLALMVTGWYYSPLWLVVGPFTYTFTYLMYQKLHREAKPIHQKNATIFKLFAVFGAVVIFIAVVIFSASGGKLPRPLLTKFLNKTANQQMIPNETQIMHHQMMFGNSPLQQWEWQQQPGWQTNEPSWNPLQDNNQFMRYQILYK